MRTRRREIKVIANICHVGVIIQEMGNCEITKCVIAKSLMNISKARENKVLRKISVLQYIHRVKTYHEQIL